MPDSLFADLRSILREDRMILALSAAYVVLGALVLATVENGPEMMLSYYFRQYAFAWIVCMALAALIGTVDGLHAAVFDAAPGTRCAAFAAGLRGRLPDRNRLFASALAAMLVVPVILSVFTSLKNAIPDINPFAWDEAFARLDLALHFGRHPYAWLQPLLGRPGITAGIEFLYAFWGVVLGFSTVWFATRRGAARRRFLLAFVMVWIFVGTVAAIGLSSAGPCYYGRVTGLPDPYAPLMEYLATASGLSGYPAVAYQEYLWRIYAADGAAAFTGISAMPSMHVALSTLFVLGFWRGARWLRYGMLAFCVAILAGSVHLGWHYAVDGYAAIALTLAIWKVAGWIDAVASQRRSQAAAQALAPAPTVVNGIEAS